MQKAHQGAGALRKLEAIQQLIAHLRPPANHVAHVQLGHLVVRQIQAGQPLLFQLRHQSGGFLAVGHLQTDKHLRCRRTVITIIEFGDIALAQQGAEFAETARPLGNADGQNRLALLTHLGAFGDEAETVKIHVGARGHCRQRPVLPAMPGDIFLESGYGQRPRRLQYGARILEHILDRRTNGIGIHQHHVVHIVLAQAESFASHLLDGCAVGEQANILQPDPPSCRQRTLHGRCIGSFHTNDFCSRAQALDIGRHPGNQPATTHRTENRIHRRGMLAQHFHGQRALAGNHLGIIVRMHEGQLLRGFQHACVLVSLAIGFTGQHHLGTTPANGIDLDLWCGHRHHDHGPAAQSMGRQGDSLGMVAGRCRNHAARALRCRQMHHFVVGTAQLEGKHRLQILALEQDVIAAAR